MGTLATIIRVKTFNIDMINEYENILRTIISEMIGSTDSSPFNVSKDRIDKWNEKREIETKKYKGVNLETRIIYYSDFYDLKNIISKNWDKFKVFFDDKKKFEVYFDQMETFRNTLSHGRTLLFYQEKLIEGILGELKTLLINYHNKNMNPTDYFVRILKVSDNLGNTWNDQFSRIGMITKSVIRVGDFIEINVEAFDPKGREIDFEIYNGKFKFQNKTGKFQFEITEKMIGNPLSFSLYAKTIGQKYTNSDQISVHYTVLPKEE
ncbi:hypothetical protein [Flavobacterium luminosum]|uniref:Swt1-like HEPN domain-containing protein n=1 Tax=Flavobacterium luminosum TaxID=2949086 RepID=A0ABT0TRG8_9FLAO|nr:hypothetical protein [Flavobacterium sp. HXWNR70]MCL9810077.1 hypothetical protein [Flavobacterium sp. HXWNR70]